MKIAVEGCCHGELDAIYTRIAQLEAQNNYKVDLLLICGDFQAVRNDADLQCMAVPDKYKELKDFYKYYSGERTAPILTIIIGGNHEASNYLWELYHGGWLAPNIYFLGHAGSVLVNGIRIAGASGIFKAHDFRQGNHEKMPYDSSAVRSIYHIREYCVRKLSLLPAPTSIFLSHDWPHQIEHHGDLRALLARKSFLRADIDAARLGSPPLMGLLTTLRPQWWFAAHLHTRFEAIVAHEGGVGEGRAEIEGSGVAEGVVEGRNPDEIVIDDDEDDARVESSAPTPTPAAPPVAPVASAPPTQEYRNPDEIMLSDEEDTVSAPPPPPAPQASPPPGSVTRFLALDKCLPRRQCLEIIDVPTPDFEPPTSSSSLTELSSPQTPPQTSLGMPKLTYDPHWLAITRAFNPVLSLTRSQLPFPDEDTARAMVAREMEWVTENVGEKGVLEVGKCQVFAWTAPPILDEAGNGGGGESGGSGRGGRGGRGARGGRGRGGVQNGGGGKRVQPSWYTNPQTVAFCEMLGIDNKINPPPPGLVASAADEMGGVSGEVEEARIEGQSEDVS